MNQDASDLRERLRETLGTTYDFERELGGGGMSRVFVAVERRFDRRVVVKVLAPELAAGVSAERFAREVMLAARLQQANIVPVFDSGEIDGLPYYTMPWIEGESLRARLDARGAASISETVAIVSDVARALSYAHAHGVVHRDIKPENILRSGHTAVVTDFGIAKAISAARTLAPFETLTQVGTSLGTPAYMAPEQAMGDPATDHRADLYALGVVAYELLAGERPFTASTLHELVRAHVTQIPAPIASRRPDVPPPLAELVMRALEKDPADRPQSADELLQTLERLHDLPSGERTAGPTLAPRRVIRRLAVFAGLGVLAIAAIAGTLWWRRDRAPVATLDPGRVLVATPIATDSSLRELAAMSQSAISRALGELQSVRLAEGGAIASRPGGNSDSGATRAARSAQAGTVVTANLYPLGADSVRLDIRVLDANSGDLVRAIRPIRVARSGNDSAWTAALDPLLATLAITSFPWLGVRALPIGEPPRFAAVREMLTGLALIPRADSASRAAMLVHSTRAISLDTTFLQAQLWRAVEARSVLPGGYSAFIQALIDTANHVVAPQRDRLNPFEGTLFDYVAATGRNDAGAVLDALRRMQDIAPDVILARDLPNRLLDVNRPREALVLLQHARPTRGFDGKLVQPSDAPQRWAALADVYHYLGDHASERDAAAQLRRLRPDDPISIRYELKAAAALHDSAEVERLLAQARLLPTPSTTYDFFGDLELQVGQEARAHGQERFGRALVQRAIDWFDAQPADRPWRERVRHAIAYHDLHDETRALAMLRTVPGSLGAIDTSHVLYLGLRGRIAAASGDTLGARAADSALESRGRGLSGANTLERAFIAANLDQRDRAVSLLQEVFAQGYGFSIRWRLHWLTDTRSLRGYSPFEQLLQPQG